VAGAKKFEREWGALPGEKGLTLPQMMEAAKTGKLKALYVVGSNPVGRLGIDPFAL
jgi:predicted molibdopterin-dependent oxidoreductase YjgC